MKTFQDILIRYQGAVSFVLVILLLGLGAAFSVANAQDQHAIPEGLEGRNQTIPMICAEDARDLYNALKKTHGEHPVAFGFSNQAHLAVIWFTDPSRTTLSIVVDAPTESCMIFSTRCLPGDCFVTGPELYEQEVDKQMDTPKVNL